MSFVPIPNQPGLFQDSVTGNVFNIRRFWPAHVIWTFSEGPKHPSVRLATSVPNMEWPFILSAASTPLVGNGEGYFRLKEFAVPLVGVQRIKTTHAVLIRDMETLREAELYNAEVSDKEIIIGFGVMRS